MGWTQCTAAQVQLRVLHWAQGSYCQGGFTWSSERISEELKFFPQWAYLLTLLCPFSWEINHFLHYQVYQGDELHPRAPVPPGELTALSRLQFVHHLCRWAEDTGKSWLNHEMADWIKQWFTFLQPVNSKPPQMTIICGNKWQLISDLSERKIICYLKWGTWNDFVYRCCSKTWFGLHVGTATEG